MAKEYFIKKGGVRYALANFSKVLTEKKARAILKEITDECADHLPALPPEVNIRVIDTKPFFIAGDPLKDRWSTYGSFYPGKMFSSGKLRVTLFYDELARNNRDDARLVASTVIHEVAHLTQYYFNNYFKKKYVGYGGLGTYSQHAHLRSLLAIYNKKSTVEPGDNKKITAGVIKMIHSFFETCIVEGFARFIAGKFLFKYHGVEDLFSLAEDRAVAVREQFDMLFKHLKKLNDECREYADSRREKDSFFVPRMKELVADRKKFINDILKFMAENSSYESASMIGEAVILSVIWNRNGPPYLPIKSVIKKSPFKVIKYYQKYCKNMGEDMKTKKLLISNNEKDAHICYHTLMQRWNAIAYG